MKCPFRTIVTKTNIFTNEINPKYKRIQSITEDIEFKDCLERECPFYQWNNSSYGGNYTCTRK